MKIKVFLEQLVIPKISQMFFGLKVPSWVFAFTFPLLGLLQLSCTLKLPFVMFEANHDKLSKYMSPLVQ